jgi:hypothetical protein
MNMQNAGDFTPIEEPQLGRRQNGMSACGPIAELPLRWRTRTMKPGELQQIIAYREQRATAEFSNRISRVAMGAATLDLDSGKMEGRVGSANPTYPKLIPGGSSSGSAVAVAVAAGLADIELGTDTSGSVRLPAAANRL